MFEENSMNTGNRKNSIPKAILDAFNEPVFCCDASGTCLYSNREFLRLLDLEELDEDCSNLFLFEQKGGDSFLNMIKYAVKCSILSGKPDELELARKEGDFPQYLQIKIDPISEGDEGKPYVIVRMTDVTERKQLEIAAAEKEALLVKTQKISNTCHYIFDLNSKTWEGSAQLYEIFGIDESTSRGKEGFFSLITPEWRSLLEDYCDLIRTDEQRFEYEYKTIRRNDGAARWIHGGGEFVFDRKHFPVKLIGTFEDVTQWKDQEEELVFLGYHDKLTGLYNRRFYEEELRTGRYGTEFANLDHHGRRQRPEAG